MSKEKDDEDDELIKELIPWYLTSEKENLTLLEAALAKKDFATFIEIGDKMYGHGSSYGFPFIALGTHLLYLNGEFQNDIVVL